MDERCGFEREIAIENGGRPPVRADIRSDLPGRPLPPVFILHGFLGFKRWGWFPLLSRRLARAGFHTVTVSFSMNGTDEETGMITRPDEFAANTVSREIEDLKTVLRFARDGNLPLHIDHENLGLFGHSRGGAVAILTASDFHEIKSLVTWSTPSRLDRYTEKRKEEWKKTGRLDFRDSRAEAPLRLDYSYYRDIDRNRERYDLPAAASRLKAAHLMVHGERDAAVTLGEAGGLLKYPRKARFSFEVIEGCGHTFGVRHPMRSSTGEFEKALELTAEWFKNTVPRKAPS